MQKLYINLYIYVTIVELYYVARTKDLLYMYEGFSLRCFRIAFLLYICFCDSSEQIMCEINIISCVA